MGTEVEVLLDADPAPDTVLAVSAAEREFHRLELLLSRFLADSELTRLNRAGTLAAGRDLLAVTELALAAREQTGGRFDPTVHEALVAAGYDRTFSEVPADGPPPAPPTAACGGGVRVNRASATIDLEPGTRLDLGGIAKGYAVDRALALLAPAGPALVNAGGDLAACGRPWPVAVETAKGTITLELAAGALATSGCDRRRWSRGGEEYHHLIDPATSRPAASDLLRVTATAGTAVEAEVEAKTLFLAGSEAARREADERGIPSVLVTRDGRTILAGGFA
jgi:thiamine biosynthesis lipoprotein